MSSNDPDGDPSTTVENTPDHRRGESPSERPRDDVDERQRETDGRRGTESDDRRDEASDERLELAASVELLTAENRRLREEYIRARTAQYRRTAQGLATIGVVAAVSGVLVSEGSQVLFAIAATGLIGAVLTRYLTPGQFVAADVGERIYAATARNGAALVDELGLRSDRIYVPNARRTSARLFVPQRPNDDVPGNLARPIVTDDDGRGLVLEPTGSGLFREFERVLTDDLPTEPSPLATALADGLVEGFELARSADPDVDAAGGRATIAITDSAFGDVDRFDHPVASFLGVGFAVGLDRPIVLEVTAGDDRADWLVTARWNGDEDR